VGLRVFGQEEGPDSCNKTVLLVEPNPKQTAKIQNELGDLSPIGLQAPLTEAMVQAFNDLELAPDKRNALIILTAGEDSCDPEGVEQVSTLVQRLNVRVDTYIVGLAIEDPAIEENLRALANVSEGAYLPAHSTDQLGDVLELIQENLEAERRPEEIAVAPTPVPTETATPTADPTATPTEAVAAALTAQEAYEIALTEALQWQPDAVLSEIGTSALGPLDAEGKSTSWSASFWSPSAGELSSFIFIEGVLQPSTPVELPTQPNLVSFDEAVTLDTKTIYDTAEAAGGSEYTNQGYVPAAALTQYPLDENVATWYVNYSDPDDFSVVFNVIIDARTGEVIQALDLR
jgi:hypothetical protein